MEMRLGTPAFRSQGNEQQIECISDHLADTILCCQELASSAKC